MKKLVMPLAAAILAATSSLALAATATGPIKSVDAKDHTVMLASGQIYHTAMSVDLSKLKVGEKVTITYQVTNGKNEASAIVAS